MMSGYISHGGECASKHEPIVNSHRGLRILLVDDSALIRKATSRSLINEGYSVEVARQGAECLKMLEASRATCKSGGYGFDVVLMDMQMPVMDGLEATRRIRALEQAEEERCHGGSRGGGSGGGGGSGVSRHITIIGVSAHTEGEARAECADCGMDSFIEKPLQMKHLRRCLLSMNLVAEVKVNTSSSDDCHDLDRQTIMEILPIR
jgi:CheY-like chemotaxis protein